jgi:hypothetical protein
VTHYPALVLSAAITGWAKDPRLAQVTTIYVSTDYVGVAKGDRRTGRHTADVADIARDLLASRRTCFRLANSIEDASAIMDLREESHQLVEADTAFSGLTAWASRVHMQLSDPTGDLFWERGDVSIGGQRVTMLSLFFQLAKDAGCPTRGDLAARKITTLAVEGRGNAATTIRARLRAGKVCLALAPARPDATLIVEEGLDQGRFFGGIEATAFGSLILPGGETAWSRKENYEGGTKGSRKGFRKAGARLLRRLAKACGCGSR